MPGVNYDTLCAIDALDPTTGTFGLVTATPRQKITCRQCWQIWRGVVGLGLREHHFHQKARA